MKSYLMKTFKRALSILLIASMVFTSQAFVTFAENANEASNIMEVSSTIEVSDIVEASSKSSEEPKETNSTVETSDTMVVSSESSEESKETSNIVEASDIVGESSASPKEFTNANDIATASDAENTSSNNVQNEPEEVVLSTKSDADFADIELEFEIATKSEVNFSGEELFGNVESTPKFYVFTWYNNTGAVSKGLLANPSYYEQSFDSVPSYVDDTMTMVPGYAPIGFYKMADDGSFSDGPTMFASYDKDHVACDVTGFDGLKSIYDTWKTAATLDKYYGTVYTHAPTVVYNTDNAPCTNHPRAMNKYSKDLTTDPIVLDGRTGMYAYDTSIMKQYPLLGWNTASDGTGTHYDFGAEISDASLFTDYVLTLYGEWGPAEDLTWSITYSQNLPDGYTMPATTTWYADQTSDDYTTNPVTVSGSNTMKCVNATNDRACTLTGWKLLNPTTGDSISFGTVIDNPSKVNNMPRVTLFAQWSNSAPYTPPITPFLYWYVDGDTMHFSNTDAAGRTPITNDADGLVYTGLTQTSIKHVVVDDNITVTEARKFFYYFSNLEDITGIEKLNFSSVTSFKQMFHGCTNLGTLDLASMNTSSATSMYAMFNGCSNLEYLNLKSFNTSNVTDMTNMFYACTKLASIYVSDAFDVSNVTNSSSMFQSCSKLFGESGTEYDSSKKDKSYAHIDGGTANPGYFTTVPTYSNWLYWYFSDNDLTLHLTNVATGHNNTFASIKANDKDQIIYEGLSYKKRRALTKVVFDTNINALAVRGMFNDFLNIEEIQDINKLNTSSAKDMSYMFHYCQKLKSINVSGFDTSNVTNMEYMFAYCKSDSLTSLDCSNFNTSKVTNMRYMFFNCIKATSIKVTNFDTSNVTLINNMFCSCDVVTTLNLSSFDTRKVTKSSYMFNGCLAVQAIYVSDKFVLDNVTGYYDSQFMFSDCPNLVGAEGTVYDSTKTDKTYARIDEGATAPGYFSGPVADRSTLDVSGTPKFYVVGYNGSNANKVVYSVTKTAGEAALTNILNSLEKPDPTCNVNGYYAVISSMKDEDGHRVFLSEDALKTKYDQTTTTVEKTQAQLLAEYSTFVADTNIYDLYFGVIYSPFISRITGVIGITIPTVGTGADQISYVAEGSSNSLTGVSITVELSDGTTNTITYESDSTNFSLEPATYSATDTTLKIKYKGLEYTVADNLYVYKTGDTYDITGLASNPTKTVYIEGDTFDPRGMSINAHVFPNVTGATTELSYADHQSDFIIPTTPLAMGDTSVTIKYGHYNGCSYNVPITVIKRGESSAIAHNPARTYYQDGEILDANALNGLQVTVTYPAGTTPATRTFTYPADSVYFNLTPAVGTTLSPSNNKITINIAGTNVEYPIVVEPAGTPTGVSKAQNPIKTDYITGDTFDPKGLKINVTYPGGITKTIEYLDPETKNNFTFNPSGALNYGTSAVLVSYKGSSATAEIPITVRKQVSSITIAHDPSNLIYSKGDKFDPSGLVVHVTYTDSSEEDVTYSASTASTFTFTPSLNEAFDSGDVGNKVQVSFGNSPAVTIANMQAILDDKFAFANYNVASGKVDMIYDSSRDAFIAMLDDAIANGAKGFHEYNAAGLNDAKKKYNKYTPVGLTREEAIAKYDEYVATGSTGKKFIGPSFPSPSPSPTPTPSPSSGGSSSGDSTSPSVGPMGDLTKDPKYNQNILPQSTDNNTINTSNNLTQSNLINNKEMIYSLLAFPENANAKRINVTDTQGNKGYGQWQRVPNTTTWYFVTGDYGKPTESIGFVSNGWYNLGWDGQNNWYYFDNNGVMQSGWREEAGKTYYLQADTNDNWYGRAVTGKQVINGTTYNFDSNGALIR